MLTPALTAAAMLLAACGVTTVAPPASQGEVRPVTAPDALQGRWTITAVNGEAVRGYWLHLGAEGVPKSRDIDRAKGLASVRDGTRAHIGCNDWSDLSWTRNGDKLTIAGGQQTERACTDPKDFAREEQASRILRLLMTMEFTPPARLRLVNEAGTLDLVRYQGVG